MTRLRRGVVVMLGAAVGAAFGVGGSPAPTAPRGPGTAAGPPVVERQVAEVPGHPPAPPPADLSVPLEVRETTGVARRGEIAESGVPLPRSLALQDAAGLAVVDASGRAVPSEIAVASRWPVRAGRGPVHWLRVAFPAAVAARGASGYRLVAVAAVGAGPGVPAAPTGSQVLVSREGQGVRVATGAAVFVLGGTPGALFDEVRLANGTLLAGGGETQPTVDGAELRWTRRRRLAVQREGPLVAVITVEDVHGPATPGGGALVSWRRYELRAGSATALVRQVLQWEGDLGCAGCAMHQGRPNAVRVRRLRSELRLAPGMAQRVLVLAERDGAALGGAVVAGPGGSGADAVLRQRLRAARNAPLRYEASAGGVAVTGARADGGMVAVGGAAGTLAVGIRQMHRYEPQALRVAGATLQVDVADDQVWLANHQGLFANLAVAALPGIPDRDRLVAAVWAPLNRPLRPWPEVGWLSASGALPELPPRALPAGGSGYDELVPAVLARTLAGVDSEGLAGLQTFGLYPRYWGKWGSPELECSRDPSPGEAWDDLYWCGTWTDYHDTVATAALWAMRTGELEWLDEIAFPAAWRALHTQVMQCAPGDPWFYCGQAPAGYGAYRADFNSSHAYFENLFYYHLLSGDERVVETLDRGMTSQATHLREKHSVVSRVGAQWAGVARFLGTLGDREREELFRWAVETALAEHYAELDRDGRRFGFWSKEALHGPGTYVHEQLWLPAFYDFDNLWLYHQDTGGGAGPGGVDAGRALHHLGRTYSELASRLEGAAGGVDGKWPRALSFTWDGAQVGGRLVRCETVAGEPRHLFSGDKPAMAAFLVRAAHLSADPELDRVSAALVRYSLDHARREDVPLGKLMGLGLHRLHGAVALQARDAERGARR